MTTAAQFPAETDATGALGRYTVPCVPDLWGYARDLFQRPGFGETVDCDYIKRHDYVTHDRLNPARIVPLGPVVDWLAPHDRARLG